MRPFHFAILFWGDHYREHYFVDKWLRSMMAPGNLPILNAADGHKLVIACPRDQWRKLFEDPFVIAAKEHVGFEWIEIDDPDPGPDDNIRTKAILHQHKWFAKLLSETHDPKALGSVWSPDCIVSAGLVAAMRKWATKGHDVVICPVLRQAEESLLEEIGHDRWFTSREVADLSIRHLHHEMDPFIEPVHRKLTHAPYRLWPMPSGYLVHGFFGLPVFMDYCVVSPHYREGNIDTCLRTGNFVACKNLHVVNDSDELSVVSLTPKDFKNYQTFPEEKLTRYDTLANMRTAYKFFGDDWVRRQMWRTPIRWHSEDITDEWLDKENEIERQMNFALDDNWFTKLRFDLPKQLKSKVAPIVERLRA
jgi:hypothetical protein